MKEAKQKGESIPPQAEDNIPILSKDQEEWVNSLFPIKKKFSEVELGSIFPRESLGRKLNDIIVGELQPIRDKIAHALLDYKEEKEVVSIDDATEVQKVYRWLPMARCIARLLMMKEFPDVFKSLSGKGTIQGGGKR